MKKILLLGLALLGAFSLAFAQDRTVSGKVLSTEDNSPLPGVNIVVKGTATGAVTDLDGNYKLSVPENTILQFSFIGYEMQEIEVGNRSVIDVTLDSDAEQLSEVIVTGYSSVKKANLTSAISTVAGEELQSQPIGGIDNLLQGHVLRKYVLFHKPFSKTNISLSPTTTIRRPLLFCKIWDRMNA